MRNRTERFLHDARGPLNTISVNAELAKLLAQKSGASDNIVNALNIILNECQRCNQILYEFGAESAQEISREISGESSIENSGDRSSEKSGDSPD